MEVPSLQSIYPQANDNAHQQRARAKTDRKIIGIVQSRANPHKSPVGGLPTGPDYIPMPCNPSPTTCSSPGPSISIMNDTVKNWSELESGESLLVKTMPLNGKSVVSNGEAHNAQLLELVHERHECERTVLKLTDGDQLHVGQHQQLLLLLVAQHAVPALAQQIKVTFLNLYLLKVRSLNNEQHKAYPHPVTHSLPTFLCC